MKNSKEKQFSFPSFIFSALFALLVMSPFIYRFWKMEIPQKAIAETTQEKPISRFNQITQEKNELERSINALKIKSLEIKSIQEELNIKINSSMKKIILSMDAEGSKKDFPPLRKKISDRPILTYTEMQKDESVQRNLQSIQYNEAYVKKLDEIGAKVSIAITRSGFIIDRIDTDLRVASVIGEDMIDKMRDEISEGIKENIPLSTNLDLSNRNIKPTATLLDIWNRIYEQWAEKRNKVQTVTETLDQFKKSILILEEKKSELLLLSRTAYEKASSSRNNIQNLKQRGRITAEVDLFGIVHYVNYTCASFEEIHWDKSTIKELQAIQHNEVYAEVLTAVGTRFTTAISNSNSIIARINNNELGGDFEEIKKMLKINLSLINNLDINKIKAVSSVTPKEIWERMHSNPAIGCPVRESTAGVQADGSG